MKPVGFRPSRLTGFTIVLLLSSLVTTGCGLVRGFKFVTFLLKLITMPYTLVILRPRLSTAMLMFSLNVMLLVINNLTGGCVFTNINVNTLNIVNLVISKTMDCTSSHVRC